MHYFKYPEFDQDGLPGSGQKFMDRSFLASLDILRLRCKFPLIISSGYRTPEYNAKISNTGLTGPHTTGKAADIAVSHEQAFILLKHVYDMKVFTGIGIKQHANGRFIHLDTLAPGENGAPRPTIWSYS